MIALERPDSNIWLRITWECTDPHHGIGTGGYGVGWKRIISAGPFGWKGCHISGFQIQREAT